MKTTTCDACGYTVSAPVPEDICSICGEPTRTSVISDAVAVRISVEALPPTVLTRSKYAGAWYADALREAQFGVAGDHHARRREIVFAVCCAESYIYEWTFDTLEEATGRAKEKINKYFPERPKFGWNRSLIEQWREVPNNLHRDGYLVTKPDFSGPHGNDWRKMISYRNGLVHALISRQEVYAPTQTIRPIVTTSDLSGLAPGWAIDIVVERIRRLHVAAETPEPDWPQLS